MPSPFEAFEHAVAIAKGQSGFGRVIKRPQTTINYWLEQKKPLPAEHVLDAEAHTGVSRYLLRPDVYPLPVGETVPSLPDLATARARVACDRRPFSHEQAA